MRRPIPVLLALCALLTISPAGASCLSAGDGHTAAVDPSGGLWIWGAGQFGQQGDGSLEDAPAPARLLEGAVSVSCGGGHTAALLADGTLWAWGDGQYGQLGVEGVERSAVPVLVMENVAAVSCGDRHTAAVDREGALWLWGSDDCGQLGLGREEGDPLTSAVPVKVMEDVAAVSCGGSHTAAVKADGTLWTWGGNGAGQLGDGSTEEGRVPARVMENVFAVSCGGEHTAAVRTDGTLWTWGSGRYGQLGDGSAVGSPVPVQVLSDVTAVSCGWWHTAAVRADGGLWTWGWNGSGQLGDGTTRDASRPAQVMAGVSAVSCGLRHTAAVKADGTLWTWGSGRDGQLGGPGGSLTIGGTPLRTAPGQVEGMSAGTAPAPVYGTAYENSVPVLVDGVEVVFPMYSSTAELSANFVRVRDLAYILRGTPAEFQILWSREGGAALVSHTAYTVPEGYDPTMAVPFAGKQLYADPAVPVPVDGADTALACLSLQNGGYTYYRLRDLGAALGFNVGYDHGTLFIQTDVPYDPGN